MSKTSKILYFILTFIFFTCFDFILSEQIIKYRFKLSENPVFDLVYVQNTGAAFSIFENAQKFLVFFAILAIFLILFYGIKNAEKFSVFAGFWCAMLLGGITCNLYERITLGYVRDFFMLNFVSFPIFNISDIFITIGVIALIVLIIKNKYLKK